MTILTINGTQQQRKTSDIAMLSFTARTSSSVGPNRSRLASSRDVDCEWRETGRGRARDIRELAGDVPGGDSCNTDKRAFVFWREYVTSCLLVVVDESSALNIIAFFLLFSVIIVVLMSFVGLI